MLVLQPPPIDTELSALRAFRRAARDIYRIFAPLAHYSLTLNLREPASPKLDSFPEDAFRSLAMAVRQVYMPSEAVHFEKVAVILERTTDPDVREYVDILRNNWHFALVSPMGLEVDGHTYGGKQVLDTWLNARAMHRDVRRQADAERLDQIDLLLLPTSVVQRVVRDLAICILRLDYGVADALGEDPLQADQGAADAERQFRFTHR